ncbi:carboxypeptidase-like regulatory domain-containing protein [Dysgonomonas sp. 25]|uniref:carboxypeptidase-like regulatory domain-containing protein n=1 Tax=Dysgonomonas sp. 25 TaxID=2302933 RepID=UPI0013D0DE01|nr:carboxypeptidase-like regulatory domain-containing protein [Dysgonomonas sp. 25]NDV69121.1 hypothetical protein [Dysgonomonas sp. 25]
MKKNIIIYLVLAVAIFSFPSCDVWLGVRGTVVDSETSEPLKGVKVFINNEKGFTTTDSIGNFYILSEKNYAFKKVKNASLELRFELDDYKLLDRNMFVNKKDSIFYLEKIK